MRVSKKIITALVILILPIFVLLTGCSPSFALKSFNIDETVDFFDTGNEYRYMARRGSSEVAVGNSLALYYDKASGGVTFFDRGGGKNWNSLPEAENSVASNFYIKVLYDGKLYLLDTAANAAENGNISYKTEENSVTVTYKMKADGVSVELPVQFTLRGSYISVSIDMTACKVSEDAKLISVSVLPFMGALSYADDYKLEQLGDYFLLPDGPGAVMYTAIEDDNFKSAVFSVYGKEYYEESIPASVAAFGIKSLNNTLSVTVTEGDENALIRVIRSNYSSDATNRVYPEFIITPVSGESGDIKAGDSYNGKIEVCYEPASGNDTDYITMAVAVRQSLINAGFMNYESVNEEYPFFVSVINSTDGTRNGTVTSFQQTENLLTLLKGKGVNNIELILEGAFSGGLGQKNNSSLRALSKAGGAEDMRALCEYAASQQISVFGGINFSSSESRSDCIKGLNGDDITLEITDPVFGGRSGKDIKLYYKEPAVFSDMSANIIRLTEKTGLDGICLLDSEISAFYTRSSSEAGFSAYTDALSSAVSSVSIDSLIMTDGCNMNIIGNADILRNVPFETAIPESVSYKAVPFIPALLHSSYIYTGTPVNDAEIPELALLKYIEYGAAPHYQWCFSADSDKFYEKDINDAASFYLDALGRLGDISSKRITDHFMYEEGVYCTEYEGGTKIYVNYNNYSVILGDISVMPYDFLRIG